MDQNSTKTKYLTYFLKFLAIFVASSFRIVYSIIFLLVILVHLPLDAPEELIRRATVGLDFGFYFFFYGYIIYSVYKDIKEQKSVKEILKMYYYKFYPVLITIYAGITITLSFPVSENLLNYVFLPLFHMAITEILLIARGEKAIISSVDLEVVRKF